jgi:hypothetical protein
MCKIGVLAIGVDLYLSAFDHFQALLNLLQYQQSIRNVALDLAAHFLALMTLVQTFRGRVNRQTAGRIVAPVLAVKAFLELQAMRRGMWERGGLDVGSVGGLVDILGLAKTALFLFMTTKLGLGKDASFVGPDEWFPKQNHACGFHDGDGGVSGGGVTEGSTSGERRGKKEK